jgi:hypothetical protein
MQIFEVMLQITVFSLGLIIRFDYVEIQSIL